MSNRSINNANTGGKLFELKSGTDIKEVHQKGLKVGLGIGTGIKTALSSGSEKFD